MGEARLAPVYDLITTTAYLPKAGMALTMDGCTHWPTAKKLRAFGEMRMMGAPKKIEEILERVADAMSDAAEQLRMYARENPAFAPVGARMLEEWETGRQQSLGS